MREALWTPPHLWPRAERASSVHLCRRCGGAGGRGASHGISLSPSFLVWFPRQRRITEFIRFSSWTVLRHTRQASLDLYFKAWASARCFTIPVRCKVAVPSIAVFYQSGRTHRPRLNTSSRFRLGWCSSASAWEGTRTNTYLHSVHTALKL